MFRIFRCNFPPVRVSRKNSGVGCGGVGSSALLPESWIGLQRVSRVALATLFAVGMVCGEDYLYYENPDGSFPDHGGCTYFGPPNGSFRLFRAADELVATQMRTWQTQRVLASIPVQRRVALRAPNALGIVGNAANPVACSGIDDCIRAAADAAGVPLTHTTTDSEFLRRVRLDLTGRIATRQEVLDFLGDASSNKRVQLVDRLLQTPEWADRWAMFFGDLFRNTVRTAQVVRFVDGRDSLHLYLLESMRQNKPYDQMAREMLAAEGFSDGRTYPEGYETLEHYQSINYNYHANPVRASPVGYIVGGQTTGGPIQDTYDTLAFFTARDFLGIALLDCVLCHDGEAHLDALSVWGARAKRLEGWQLAAFFSDLPHLHTWRTPANQLPFNPLTGLRVPANYYKIQDLAKGQAQTSRAGDMAGYYLAWTRGGNRPDRNHDEAYVEPAYPFAGTATVSGDLRLREQLGFHLTSDPQFARAAVNYIWQQFFSRGIVEPPTQFDLARLDSTAALPDGWGIQPSHPELLEWLAQGFRDSGFDLKWLMREITTSQTYQLSSRYQGVFHPLHEKYFVRYQAKRLSAEAVHDAIVQASGVPITYFVSHTLPSLQRAMQFPDVVDMPPGPGPHHGQTRLLLRAFTPGDREETARGSEGSPLQALNLMNNPFVLNRVRSDNPTGTLVESLQLADDALAVNLYLTVLNRQPTNEELAFAVEYLQEGERSSRASNLIWAMFNRTEFYFNY